MGGVPLKLPGLQGTYSRSFLPVLYGLNHFTAAAVLVASGLSAVAGSLIERGKRPQLNQILFNAANLTLSAATCLLLYGYLAENVPYLPATLCVMVSVYFAINTLFVSIILSLIQGKPLTSVYEAWYFWSFVCYLAGAMGMGLAMAPSRKARSGSILVPVA